MLELFKEALSAKDLCFFLGPFVVPDSPPLPFAILEICLSCSLSFVAASSINFFNLANSLFCVTSVILDYLVAAFLSVCI